MERAMTVEEKIRRAEQIYERRKQNSQGINSDSTVKIKTSNDKKDLRLLKKMIIQIVVCILIYVVIYTIQNSNYIFSEDFINKANEVLSYDTNFGQIYNDIKSNIMSLFNFNKKQENTEQNNQTENQENNQENSKQNQIQETNNLNPEQAIGGAEGENTEQEQTQNQEISQEEQDIINVKNTTTFIKPIEGTITSTFGQRDLTTPTVPKNHTGTDIAAVTGTKIKSATDGEVVLASEEGDYGKHLKIQIGEVSIIYAHCNNLYVKQGDKITQGQEIAEVGSTGNSTGPHLHFEIRYAERTVDPQKILEL